MSLALIASGVGHPIKDIFQLYSSGRTLKGMMQLKEALIPYNQRFGSNVSNLMTKTSNIDYGVKMSLTFPKHGFIKAQLKPFLPKVYQIKKVTGDEI